MSAVAIIGGTGLCSLPGAALVPQSVQTRFGVVPASRALWDGQEVVFLPRHGEGHTVAPHEIDCRANIAALVELGVKRALATNAVGALHTGLAPGDLVLLSDFIDFTRSRPLTFLSGPAGAPCPVIHTDFSEPYCAELRAAVLDAAAGSGMAIKREGVYLCTDGPRYESPAEVRLFASWGADVVGMTGLPEAIFAREAGICYAAVAIVTNLGAGLAAGRIAHGAVTRAVESSAASLRDLLLRAIGLIPPSRTCACAH